MNASPDAESQILQATCQTNFCRTATDGEKTRPRLPEGGADENPVCQGRGANPRRQDGFVHEYCPPEQVRSELDRLLEFHHSHAQRDLPTEVEAAWLHHEFVHVHPVHDGNGRMSRLLVAYVFARKGELPPLITAAGKPGYIRMLEIADEGNLRGFIAYLANLSEMATRRAVLLADQILKGRTRMRHGNGGLTVNGRYYPPDPAASDG